MLVSFGKDSDFKRLTNPLIIESLLFDRSMFIKLFRERDFKLNNLRS